MKKLLTVDKSNSRMLKKAALPVYTNGYSSLSFIKILFISLQYLYLLENVAFTLFFAIYLLIYSIFTPILSQYFQFSYFFFFLFF